MPPNETIRSALAAVALACGACAEAASTPTPALEAGVVHDREFEAFRAGDTMSVLTAVQAGLWLMPTLRHQGFVGTPEISCIVFDLDKDIFLADREAHSEARRIDDWIRVNYNMQVDLPNDFMDDMIELQDYAGDRVLFECGAVDDVGSVRVTSHEMVLSVQ